MVTKKIYPAVIHIILFFCAVFIPLYLFLLSPFFKQITNLYISTACFTWVSSLVDIPIAKSVLNRLVGLVWGLAVLKLWHTYVDRSSTIPTLFKTPPGKKVQYFASGFLVQASILLAAVGITTFAGHITRSSTTANAMSLVVYYMLTTIIIGLNVFIEELLFRGYILQKLASRFNHNVACFLATLLFMIAHPFHALGLYGVITQAGLMGIALAYVALYYNSIYVTCGLHLANNVIVRSLYSSQAWNISCATLYDIDLLSLYDILWLSVFVTFFLYKRLWKKPNKG